MIIDTPVIVPPNSPPNRPLTGDRLGGGGTAVITETPRPVDDPEQLSAGRRNEEQATTEDRQGRNAAELAGRTRLEVARGQVEEVEVSVTEPAGSGASTTAPADTTVRAGTAGTGTDGIGTDGIGTGSDSVIPAEAQRSLQARLDVQLATAQQTEARGGVGQQLNELG